MQQYQYFHVINRILQSNLIFIKISLCQLLDPKRMLLSISLTVFIVFCFVLFFLFSIKESAKWTLFLKSSRHCNKMSTSETMLNSDKKKLFTNLQKNICVYIYIYVCVCAKLQAGIKFNDWKHQSNVWNLFKVSNKDTKTTLMDRFYENSWRLSAVHYFCKKASSAQFCCLCCQLWTNFTYGSHFSIVKQVNKV